MINLFNKTDDFIKMINLLSKTNDFHKFVHKKGRCNFCKKIQAKTCFADKDLSSWIGLGGPEMTEVRVLV